ncbi:MAG: hypothetical protein U1E73_14105 [Planctomycetota bacterium]
MSANIPLPADDFVLEQVLEVLGAPLRLSGQFDLSATGGPARECRQLVLPLRGSTSWGATELPLYMDEVRHHFGAVHSVQDMHEHLLRHRVPGVKPSPDWARIRHLVEAGGTPPSAFDASTGSGA